MSKIKWIAAAIEELLSLPIAEAAISVTVKKLNSLINSAKKLDASPADIKKLEDIRKIKSSGKPLPKKPARVTELPRVPRPVLDIGSGDFLFDGKTGSAAITAFRKNPIKRKDFVADLKRQAVDEDFSDAELREVIKRGKEYWQKLSAGKTPYTATTKRFKETKKPTEEAKAAATTAALKSFNKIAREDIVGLLKQRGKPKLSGDDKMREAGRWPRFSSAVDISKMKSLEEYTNSILKFAKDKYEGIGTRLPPQVSDNLRNRAAIAWAERTKVKPTKSPKPRKPYGYEDEPFKKGGSVKRPSMQKGGAYKGKKHNYSAGGKVNELKNFKKRKV